MVYWYIVFFFFENCLVTFVSHEFISLGDHTANIPVVRSAVPTDISSGFRLEISVSVCLMFPRAGGVGGNFKMDLR